MGQGGLGRSHRYREDFRGPESARPSAGAQAPPEVLEWRFRAGAILEEILEADADIVALQELNHYGERDWVHRFQGLGS